MLKFSFVILHYNNIEDTINCINSIKKLEINENIKLNIIIIDNKSPNNSGVQLKEIYKDENNIHVELLDFNYGFSKGNNIGYKLAKNQMSDCILVINNDILFDDTKFIIKLQEFIINNKNIDIIAPDIINLKEQHQNPLNVKPTELSSARKSYFVERISYYIYLVPFLRNIYYNIKKSKEEKWYDRYYKEKEKNIDKIFDKNDFVPFGAFIIYTNNWVKNEEFAFPSTSFMYTEEDVLYLYLKEHKYRIYYNKELKIKHLVGQSTKKRTKNKYKNARFQSKCKMDALKKYIKILKKRNK